METGYYWVLLRKDVPPKPEIMHFDGTLWNSTYTNNEQAVFTTGEVQVLSGPMKPHADRT